MKRTAAWRVLQAALLAAVAYGLYRVVVAALEGVPAAELLAWRPAALPLSCASALLPAVYLAHALLWRKILLDLKIARPSWRAAVRVYFVASLGRYIPGRFWQLAGLAALSQRAGIPPASSVGAALLGQLCFLSSGLVFLAVILPAQAEVRAAAATAVLLLVVGAAMLVLVAGEWADTIRTRTRAAVAQRIGGRAGERLGAALALAGRVRAGQAALWFVAYGVTWVALGIAFAAFAVAFVPEAAGAGRQLAGIVTASYLAGYIALFAPAGLGVRELAMAAMLAELMPGPAAVVVAAASRLWFTAAELAPLALVPLLPDDAPAGAG